MATTGKVRSNLVAVFVERIYNEDGDVTAVQSLGDTANQFDAVGAANSATISLTRDTIDATKKENDGARVILPAGEQFTMSCEGFVMYDETATFTSVSLFDIWKNKYKCTLAFSTGEDGDVMYKGDAYLVNFEQSAGTNEAATFSCQFEGTGSITKVTNVSATHTFNHV